MSRGAWTGVAERGSLLGMRFTVWVYRCCGRRVSGWLALAIVSYFFVTDARGRRASRRYLARLYAAPGGAAALGHPPGLRDCFRQYREFARCVLDRLAFALGEGDRFTVEVHGRDALVALHATGRGAVLLGAHLGNFDALRALARRDGVVVNVVMFTRHAERINGLLRRLDPSAEVRVLEMDPAVPDTALAPARLRRARGVRRPARRSRGRDGTGPDRADVVSGPRRGLPGRAVRPRRRPRVPGHPHRRAPAR